MPAIGGLVALGGLVLNSHAWGSGLVAAIVDWVHLVAVAVWVGGLACLWYVLALASSGDRLRFARVLVPRFSRVAAITLAILVLIPALNTLPEPGAPAHLSDHLVPLFGKFLCFGSFKVAYATHRSDQGANIIAGNHLLAFVEFSQEYFGNAALDVGHDFFTVIKSGEVPVDRIEVFPEVFVTVFFDVENDAADVDAYILFHSDERVSY